MSPLNCPSSKNTIEIMIEYFIEVPNTNIKEPVTGFAYDLLYDMAQEYGHAQLVWYALNGKRVVEGEYTCLLYTSPSPRDLYRSRMPSSA